jgi:hypothetical protein
LLFFKCNLCRYAETAGEDKGMAMGGLGKVSDWEDGSVVGVVGVSARRRKNNKEAGAGAGGGGGGGGDGDGDGDGGGGGGGKSLQRRPSYLVGLYKIESSSPISLKPPGFGFNP